MESPAGTEVPVVTKEAFNGDCNADYSGVSGKGTGTMTSTLTRAGT